VRWLAGLALLAGPAAGQTVPGTFLARVEAQALLATLNADLLSHGHRQLGCWPACEMRLSPVGGRG